ncbi:MAG: DUF308 domain-containing protein [Lachnospiraceae bacterium]|nr:DUF308 domain-containing protein [Lachnospiraceae bacterium]
MKDRVKGSMTRVKLDVILSALLCIGIGVVVIIWPTETTKILCWVLAAVLAVMGLGRIVMYFIDRDRSAQSKIGLSAGIILVVLAIWIALQPLNFAKIFPVIIGVVLIMHGLEDLKFAAEARGYKDGIWPGLLVIALVNAIIGVLLIWKSLQAVEIAVMLIGAALIFDGVTDLFIVFRVNRAIKHFGQAVTAIDAEAEVEEVEAEAVEEEAEVTDEER